MANLSGTRVYIFNNDECFSCALKKVFTYAKDSWYRCGRIPYQSNVGAAIKISLLSLYILSNEDIGRGFVPKPTSIV